MQNRKRILSVTVRRIPDDSPDTSMLGEYSRRPESEYTIDRAHSEDCASVVPANKEAQQTLINARGTVAELQKEEQADTQEWEALEDAYNLLDSLAEGLHMAVFRLLLPVSSGELNQTQTASTWNQSRKRS